MSDELEDVFARACDRAPKWTGPGPILLGCSAGGDSMALLELAAAAAPARGWRPVVVHADHAQRPESADEARFVATRAAAHGLVLHSERLELAPGASEDALREARHALFRRAAAAHGARAILLAHHADDRAETFLIRLLAGSGPTGLSSIRSVERLAGLTVVRPLLGQRRAELRAWLTARGLSWREDPSNDATTTQRGWIRNDLLPLLNARMGLDVVPRIERAATLIGREAEALENSAAAILARLALPSPAPARAHLALADPLWQQAGPPLRRQLLRRWLWDLRTRPHPPGHAAVEEACRFVELARPGAELRTVERIHVVHCGLSLLAFNSGTTPAERAAAVAPLLAHSDH